MRSSSEAQGETVFGGGDPIAQGGMMSVSDSQTPVVFFHEPVGRAGKIFSITVIALFGVMCLPGLFQRFPRQGADEWLFGISGLAVLVFDFLLWHFFRKPRLILSDSGMTENRHFGQREFRYADFVSLASYVEKFYPRGPNGTSSVPLFLHRLMVRTRDRPACLRLQRSAG